MTYKKRLFRVLRTFFGMMKDFRKEFKLLKSHSFSQVEKRMERIHSKRARELFDLAVEMGGVLIKLCQYFSTRMDVFPETYIKILSPLQDSVPPVSFEEIETVLDGEYGNWRDHFLSIDPEPVASASLGQTHRAVLKSGRPVILKILKPSIEEVIDKDFAILQMVFGLFSTLKIFQERADFALILEEFILVTGNELNFTREVFILNRLKTDLAKFSYLTIPETFPAYCTRRIIVMEYLHGDKLSDKDSWEKRNNDPKVIVKRLVEIYIEQFLFIRTVHFDPHPGNILIQDNSQFALIDFGMSGTVSPSMARGIKQILHAFSERDYRKIIDELDKLGFIRRGTNKKELLNVARYFFDEVLASVRLEKESLQNVNLQPVLDDLVTLMYTQPFNLPCDWTFLVKTLGLLVGITSILDPDFDIYHELEPYGKKVLHANMDELISDSVDTIKKKANTIFNLPDRIESTLNAVEQGNIDFSVDFDEIDEKLDSLREVIIRLVGFGASFFTALGGYILYSLGQVHSAIPLGILSVFSFIFSISYRKRDSRSAIKKQIQKHL